MKNISQNDLEELIELTSRIVREIKHFSHVSDHLPEKLKKEIYSYKDKLIDEHERREDEE